MKLSNLTIAQADLLQTPALVYHEDIIEENLSRVIEMAGGAERLWPHIKTHKMREMVLMQMARGIERFKCATIAEATMLADLSAKHILMAYPLVGPNLDAYLALAKANSKSIFYAIGDDFSQMQQLSEAAQAQSMRINILLDINMGMDRTGTSLEAAQALYEQCAQLPGVILCGMHGYDGHANDPAVEDRRQKSMPALERMQKIQASLAIKGIPCELLVMGGTPSFPIHAAQSGVYLSPGTIFVLDARYMLDLTDLPVQPAAVLLTRVISHPGKSLFTVDLGSKAISTDMAGHGMLLSLKEAVPVRHSEEHWVFEMPDGAKRPEIGEVLYALPMHICTTTMLYPFVHVARGGKIIGRWAVYARDRFAITDA